MPPAPTAAMTSYGPRRTPGPRAIDSCEVARIVTPGTPLGFGIWRLGFGISCCAILRRVFRVKTESFPRVGLKNHPTFRIHERIFVGRGLPRFHHRLRGGVARHGLGAEPEAAVRQQAEYL